MNCRKPCPKCGNPCQILKSIHKRNAEAETVNLHICRNNHTWK